MDPPPPKCLDHHGSINFGPLCPIDGPLTGMEGFISIDTIFLASNNHVVRIGIHKMIVRIL